MSKLSLTVQYADEATDWQAILPRPLLRRWVTAALNDCAVDAIITLRWAGVAEAQKLNLDYRCKDYATNVLTFAYNESDDMTDLVSTQEAEEEGAEQPLETDIILCGDVLRREAEEQGKTLADHAAHLIVHGVLHARGYDHLEEDEADEMEAFERLILAKMGIADPYFEGERLAD